MKPSHIRIVSPTLGYQLSDLCWKNDFTPVTVKFVSRNERPLPALRANTDLAAFCFSRLQKRQQVPSVVFANQLNL